jgi:hypothetical protein
LVYAYVFGLWMLWVQKFSPYGKKTTEPGA